MTPTLIEGYLTFNVIYLRQLRLGSVLEIFDGFGAHPNNHNALKMRLDAKNICVKEQGDSSSVNQAYCLFALD